MLYEATLKVSSRTSHMEAIRDKISSITPIIYISWSIILAILRIALFRIYVPWYLPARNGRLVFLPRH